MWIMALVLPVHLRSCLSGLYEMHCLPQQDYMLLSLQKFASLTIVHRYLEKSNVVSVLTSQRLEAPKTDILTEVAWPEFFSQCHIGHLRNVKQLEMEFRPLRLWTCSSFFGQLPFWYALVKLEGIGSKRVSVWVMAYLSGIAKQQSWAGEGREAFTGQCCLIVCRGFSRKLTKLPLRLACRRQSNAAEV